MGEPELLASGEGRLWELRFADGNSLRASDFGPTGAAGRRMSSVDGAALRLAYDGARASMAVTLEPTDDGVELTAEVSPSEGAGLEVVLPGRLRFRPAGVEPAGQPHTQRSVVAVLRRERGYLQGLGMYAQTGLRVNAMGAHGIPA